MNTALRNFIGNNVSLFKKLQILLLKLMGFDINSYET